MIEDVELSLPNRRSTRWLAAKVSQIARSGDLLILDGQLGSGKTFFVRALCRALGLSERVRVTSPTFSLVHEIDVVPKISHADLYRLTTARQVSELGLFERRDEGDLVIVEWGLPYLDCLGGDALVLSFLHDPRRVVVRATGQRSRQMLEVLTQQFANTS